jgi:uncharacterized protein (TIGR02145 family)
MRKFLILPLLLPMLALSQQICGSLVEGAETAEEARKRAKVSLAEAIKSKVSSQSNWEEIITGRKSEQRDTTRTRTEAELLNAQAAKHTDGKDKNGYSSQACMSYADAAQPYLNYLIERAGRLKNAVLALGGKSGKKEAWDNVVSIYETLKGLEGVLIPLGQMDYALQKEYEADYAKAKKEYEAFAEQSGRHQVCFYFLGKEPKKGVYEPLGGEIKKAFVKSEKYTAIECAEDIRKLLGKVHKDQRSGRVDDKEIMELGKAFGVHSVVAIKVVPSASSYYLEASVVNITGTDISGMGTAYSKLESDDDLIKAAEKIISDLLGVSGSASPVQEKTAPPSVSGGVLTDTRDGKKYKTVKIGNQTWMAENLNYNAKSGSKCYKDKPEYCEKYGRLYDWNTALKACPSGWVLPNDDEWNELMAVVDGKTGKKLKAKSGWNSYEGKSGNGTDELGFSALPGGRGRSDDSFSIIDNFGFWWSSTSDSEGNSNSAYCRSMYYRDFASRTKDYKSSLLSVRCLLMNALAYSNRGIMYYGKGDYDQAISDFTEAIRLDPKYALAYSSRGIAYFDKGDYDKAISDFTETIRLNPRWENVYNNRGYAYYYAKNDYIKAMEDFQSALRINPNSDFAQTMLDRITKNVQESTKGDVLTDKRDGKQYKTVKIGNQTWMAENLNYDARSGSVCYDNKPENCKKYGRLYNWNTALKACPSGWHLPSKSEYEELDEAVGGFGTAGRKLKAKSGWSNNGNGTDEFGFSAMPGGSRISGGNFYDVGKMGKWWNASEHESYGSSAYYRSMFYGDWTTNRDYYDKSLLFSVRCIKDSTMGKSGSGGELEALKKLSESSRVINIDVDDIRRRADSLQAGGLDTRDGKKYKTVKIGNQTWMAENLKYVASGSKCYDNKTEYCIMYGCLYDWETAKKVCPSGWHLPSDAEWDVLMTAVGGKEVAGGKLKAKRWWSNNGNGTDEYGFTALPGGSGYHNGRFGGIGELSYWWSSTANGRGHAVICGMSKYDERAECSYDDGNYLSVRCVRD